MKSDPQNAIVRARISADVKRQASIALKRIGLNTSDLIRLTFMRVAEEGRLPFDLTTPNPTTQKAMAELEDGGGTRYENVEDMYKDLGL
ncbi:type II toxin-antitoxin system RelB/DinJ family antitoxin [Bartonella sp. DGB2]|uniref:type II toxin-antitoxin system RelB/DinJ family antitoxin n=1 Tax=Bartonella sp. DGB2 TaxID=3388426 RepID=UPI00398FBB87